MNSYDVAGYGAMIADAPRFDAYRAALRRQVSEGSKVLDLGTGTGIFALLACRFGAELVHAIETGDVIQVARDIARANGLAERIRFHQDLSTRVTLPERVDLMISDLRGVLPLFGNHLPSIIDARQRFLAAGGVLIPRRDHLLVAPVENSKVYEELVSPWESTEADLDMSAARRMATECVYRRRMKPEHLLSGGQRWATLDYGTIDDVDARGGVSFSAARDGMLHGFLLWFDSELADEVTLSTAPDQPELVYGSLFLPLSRPVSLQQSMPVALEIDARHVGDGYVWRWTTAVDAGDGNDPERFSQSTFHGLPLTRRTLRHAEGSATPRLSRDGNIDRDALAMMDGDASLAEIAERLMKRFPQAFEDHRAALDRVAALAIRYAK